MIAASIVGRTCSWMVIVTRCVRPWGCWIRFSDELCCTSQQKPNRTQAKASKLLPTYSSPSGRVAPKDSATVLALTGQARPGRRHGQVSSWRRRKTQRWPVRVSSGLRGTLLTAGHAHELPGPADLWSGARSAPPTPFIHSPSHHMGVTLLCHTPTQLWPLRRRRGTGLDERSMDGILTIPRRRSCWIDKRSTALTSYGGDRDISTVEMEISGSTGGTKPIWFIPYF